MVINDFNIVCGGSKSPNGISYLELGEWRSLASFVAENFVMVFAGLYGLNMYFQSFGAIAVVKCNAPWFHVRERGVFGAIFGILISLGIYFAFDWGYAIVNGFSAGPDALLAKGDKDIGLGAIAVLPNCSLGIFW